MWYSYRSAGCSVDDTNFPVSDAERRWQERMTRSCPLEVCGRSSGLGVLGLGIVGLTGVSSPMATNDEPVKLRRMSCQMRILLDWRYGYGMVRGLECVLPPEARSTDNPGKGSTSEHERQLRRPRSQADGPVSLGRSDSDKSRPLDWENILKKDKYKGEMRRQSPTAPKATSPLSNH